MKGIIIKKEKACYEPVGCCSASLFFCLSLYFLACLLSVAAVSLLLVETDCICCVNGKRSCLLGILGYAGKVFG